jgi:general secretion pathway protein C
LYRHRSITFLRHGASNRTSVTGRIGENQLSFLQRLSPGAWRPEGARGLLEVVLVIALAAQAARLVWAIAAPPPPSPPAEHVSGGDLSILTRFNPFLGADTASGQANGDGLRLYGVRAAGGGRGSAIIGTADGRQSSYAVGDVIAPGVKLQAVEADHVVLSRGGAGTRLGFPNASQ